MLNEENASKLRKFSIANLIMSCVLENGMFVDCDTANHPTLIRKILLWINDNFKKDISPSSIAANLGYSRSYISNLFTNNCGITLTRYITLVRLKNAVSLMHSKNNSISFCAFESGFPSLRTFYRSFQNEFGCSPKKYIEKLK